MSNHQINVANFAQNISNFLIFFSCWLGFDAFVGLECTGDVSPPVPGYCSGRRVQQCRHLLARWRP